MKSTELFTLTLFIGKLLNCKEMKEKDYMQVLRVFFQFQFLLTKLVVTRCYNFLEGIAENHSEENLSMIQGVEVGKKGSGTRGSVIDESEVEDSGEKERERRSMIMAPIDTVKVRLCV